VAPQCDCRARHEATRTEGFVEITDLGGWCFVDGPIRWVSTRAQYFQGERGIENKTGEPFVWECCPFCGLDLPMTARPSWRIDATGDGPE
jgi:hypothetical protein